MLLVVCGTIHTPLVLPVVWLLLCQWYITTSGVSAGTHATSLREPGACQVPLATSGTTDWVTLVQCHLYWWRAWQSHAISCMVVPLAWRDLAQCTREDGRTVVASIAIGDIYHNRWYILHVFEIYLDRRCFESRNKFRRCSNHQNKRYKMS
jgi:hypothetical protein